MNRDWSDRRSEWGYSRLSARTEPGLESLSEWLDGAVRRSRGTRWGIWGGIVGGSSGFAGGSTGALAGVHASWELFLIPWGLWLAGAAVATIWLVRGLRADDAADLSAREPSRILGRLWHARFHGRLRTAIGAEGANHLNEGAKLALRCRTTLDSPAWRLAAGTAVWSRAADNTRAAMDAGMARLLLLTTQHGEEVEILETLGEMRAVVAEVAEAERRHALAFGAQSAKPDALRSTLEELRELSKAEEDALAELRISS